MSEYWRYSGRRWRENGRNYREFWEEQCNADPHRAAFRAQYEAEFPELRRLCGREWLARAWELKPWEYLTDRESSDRERS